MKKILFLLLIACLPISGFAKDKDESFFVKNMYGDLNVGYATKTGGQSRHWYIGARADLSFLNWENKYDNGTESGTDNFDFKSVFGGDLFVGYQFNKNIRGDLEFGYMGKYSESETEYYPGELIPVEKSEFNLTTTYLIANGYYDFYNGLYAGLGFGAGVQKISVDNDIINEKKATHISPIGAIMLGWVYDIDDSLALDLRYRLSISHGDTVNMEVIGGGNVRMEMGYIISNTLSAGIRYSF